MSGVSVVSSLRTSAASKQDALSMSILETESTSGSQ